MAPQYHFKVKKKKLFMFTSACVCVNPCMSAEARRLGPGAPGDYEPLDMGLELQSSGRATCTPNC